MRSPAVLLQKWAQWQVCSPRSKEAFPSAGCAGDTFDYLDREMCRIGEDNPLGRPPVLKPLVKPRIDLLVQLAALPLERLHIGYGFHVILSSYFKRRVFVCVFPHKITVLWDHLWVLSGLWRASLGAHSKPMKLNYSHQSEVAFTDILFYSPLPSNYQTENRKYQAQYSVQQITLQIQLG